MEISKSLRKWRRNTGYTQQEIAEILGTKANMYGKYERGEQIPGSAVIKKIAKTFHADANKLLGIE